MNPCRENLEDLALLAGGDAPEATAHELRRHAACCDGCARMLEALEADQAGLAAVLPEAVSAPSVLPAVMARLAAEACLQPHAASTRSPARAAALVPFARAAAVILAVVGAAILGVASLHHGVGSVATSSAAGGEESTGAGAPFEAASIPEVLPAPASSLEAGAPSRIASMEVQPIFVRRSGDGVVLSWAGDGRERQPPTGRPSTYKVLASSTAARFDDARPVEVAGSTLVASMSLPAAMANDRSITFFRVE